MPWNRLRRGQIEIPLQHKIDPQGFEPLRITLDSIANRLANAILASLVLVCSSILILSGLPPKAWNIPVIGLIGLILGGYMCLRLLLSIWKHGGLLVKTSPAAKLRLLSRSASSLKIFLMSPVARKSPLQWPLRVLR